MAKIGKIDTECKLRTSYYLSAGGGGFVLKFTWFPPSPRRLYNSNDPPSLAVNFL